MLRSILIRPTFLHIKRNVFLLITMLCALFYGTSFASSNKEYQLKAAYLSNTIKFASWPEDLLEEINLCIYGTNPFGSILDKIHNKETAKGTVKVKYVKKDARSENCQILYIDKIERPNAYEVISQFRAEPTLLFSNINNFAAASGDIEFTQVKGKLKIIINAKSIKRKDIMLEPLLYQIAAEVLR